MKRAYLTDKQKAELMIKQCGHCAACDAYLLHGFEFDHVQALARGGTNETENWQILCKLCHGAKTNGKPHCRLGADKYEAAKTKRLVKGRAKPKKAIPSRPFDKRLRKKMSGTRHQMGPGISTGTRSTKWGISVSPKRQPDFIRNLCIALAHRWEPERLFLILTAYFDESGTHAGSPATVLSGIMGTANQWAYFQSEMNKIKERHGFTVFHAKEFRARSGEFRRWPPPKAAALLQEMMVASSKLMEAATIILTNEAYEAYRAGEQHRRLRLDTQYALCFRYALLNFLVQTLKRLSTHKRFGETRLNIVMESGHKHAGDAERVFHEMRKECAAIGLNLLDGITFSGKNDPLSIADYLAYGGLAMERAGRNEQRPDDPQTPRSS
jgi:hypothetical protein